MQSFRRAVLIVALLNVVYGVVEFTVARVIGSVSLTADSVDFAEDAALNLLVFWASTWPLRRRARVGTLLAVVIAVPAIVTVATAIAKILDPQRPDTAPLTLTAAGALAVNLACAAILMRHRGREGSLAKAVWFSARNDALANLAILGAGAVAIAWTTGWPDILVGIAIGALNADAAVKVWRAARREAGPRRAEA